MNGLAGVIALIISAGVSYWLIDYYKKRAIALPLPRERDVHVTPVPRVGGLAIFAGFFVTALFFQLYKPDIFGEFGFPFKFLGLAIDKRLLGILLSSTVLVLIMLYDDLRGLSPVKKLLAQIFVSLIVVAAGVGLESFNLPFIGHVALNVWAIPVSLFGATYHIVPIADGLLVCWLVLLMNAMNFVDGLDGLASSLAVSSSVILIFLASGLAVKQPALILLLFIFLGSLCGFLPFNWHKAQIFLGDSGAMLIGFLLGIFSVLAGGKVATVSLVLALPLLDFFYVVLQRLMKRQNPMKTADQRHLHHKLMKANFSTQNAVIFYTAVSFVFGVLGLISSTNAKFFVIVVSFFIFFVIVYRLNLLGNKEGAEV